MFDSFDFISTQKSFDFRIEYCVALQLSTSNIRIKKAAERRHKVAEEISYVRQLLAISLINICKEEYKGEAM